MVEPVDPFEGGELDGLERAPGPLPADHLGLEEPDHGLGEGVVVAIANAADGRRDAASASRPVSVIETYWADSSGRRNTACES